MLCGISKICGVGFSFQVAVVLPERAFHAVAGEGHGAGFDTHGSPFVGGVWDTASSGSVVIAPVESPAGHEDLDLAFR